MGQIRFPETEIQQCVIHRVGNKNNDEGVILSDITTNLTPELRIALIKYFLQSFDGKEEAWNFTHEDDVRFNEISSYATEMFEGADFVDVSKKVARHLYESSVHPNIKGGELFVVNLSNVVYEGKSVAALGLFKSETKDTFLRFVSKNNNLEVENEIGANVNRLDKGCIILNHTDEKGYYVFTLDSSNRTDAKYWTGDFLGITPRQNEFTYTKDVLSMTKDFVAKVLPSEYPVSKAEQVELLNKSVNYFKGNESFSMQSYEEQVLGDEKLIDSFHRHKEAYEQEREVELKDDFAISDNAVKKQERRMKSVIKLDKNFHIYVHGGEQLIEQSYDEERGMKCYKLYFREER